MLIIELCKQQLLTNNSQQRLTCGVSSVVKGSAAWGTHRVCVMNTQTHTQPAAQLAPTLLPRMITNRRAREVDNTLCKGIQPAYIYSIITPGTR